MSGLQNVEKQSDKERLLEIINQRNIPMEELFHFISNFENKLFFLWFTGLSGSGKTTIARELIRILNEIGISKICLLDGDELRKSAISQGLSFSKGDREIHLLRMAEIARIIMKYGISTIGSFVSPYKDVRDQIREIFGEAFIEVYVSTPLEVCERRDPKGLYERARRGDIERFTGVSDPYEAPDKPEIIINTTRKSIATAVGTIVCYLMDKNFIPPLKN